MTRAIKSKADRRVRKADVQRLEQAVNYNYDAAMMFQRQLVVEIWQRFFANVAIAALLAHIERQAPNAWPELVKAVECWEPEDGYHLQI